MKLYIEAIDNVFPFFDYILLREMQPWLYRSLDYLGSKLNP